MTMEQPGTIACFVCDGLGSLGEVHCRACNGAGVIGDSGAAPDPNPGTLALRPCGHAVDWIGDGAPPEFRLERQRLWVLQGLTAKHVTDFRCIHQLLTDGAGCHCDPRATPREVVGAPDVAAP